MNQHVRGSRVYLERDWDMRGLDRARTRTTKCRMGGSAQRRLPGAWAGTGAPRRIFGWGTLPLRCLIGVGVAACSVCLSVCLSAFALAWWLVCGWLAILPLACDLRTTSVPSDFLPWATPWRFLPWISPWRCESGPRTCEVPLDDEAVRFLCCSEVLRAGGSSGPLGQGSSDSSSSLVRSLVSWYSSPVRFLLMMRR